MTLTPYFSRTPAFGQFRGKIQARLPAQIGQKGVGPFLFDDFRHRLQVERFDIGHIGHARIGHDGGRIGIDQNDLITQLSQGLAGLGAGIVEFAGLADDDGAGADDHDFLDVVAFWHILSFLQGDPFTATQQRLSFRLLSIATG